MVSKRPACAAIPRNDPKLVKSWQHTTCGDHFVQFYRTDEYLVECLAEYFAEGILAGESVLVIATGEHASALDERLQSKRVDFGVECRRKRLVMIDAEEVIQKIVRAGRLNARAFRDIVVPLIESFPDDRPLRCFGELVALLWQARKRVAALELENVWNELSAVRNFRLFCAYPIGCLGPTDEDGGKAAICHAHSRVVSLTA